MTDIIQHNSNMSWSDNYRSDLSRQFDAWKKIQHRNKTREEQEYIYRQKAEKEAHIIKYKLDNFNRIDEERDKVLSQIDKVKNKMELIKERSDIWEKTVNISSAKQKKLEAMMERRKEASILDGELYIGCTMTAHRIWELTGRSDWAGVIRKDGLDGLDIMDFTIDDAKSIKELDDPDEFLMGVIKLRDELTRPMAELIAILHEYDDPVKNWYEAQIMLKILFVKGLKKSKLCE